MKHSVLFLLLFFPIYLNAMEPNYKEQELWTAINNYDVLEITQLISEGARLKPEDTINLFMNKHNQFHQRVAYWIIKTQNTLVGWEAYEKMVNDAFDTMISKKQFSSQSSEFFDYFHIKTLLISAMRAGNSPTSYLTPEYKYFISIDLSDNLSFSPQARLYLEASNQNKENHAFEPKCIFETYTPEVEKRANTAQDISTITNIHITQKPLNQSQAALEFLHKHQQGIVTTTFLGMIGIPFALFHYMRKLQHQLLDSHLWFNWEPSLSLHDLKSMPQDQLIEMLLVSIKDRYPISRLPKHSSFDSFILDTAQEMKMVRSTIKKGKRIRSWGLGTICGVHKRHLKEAQLKLKRLEFLDDAFKDWMVNKSMKRHLKAQNTPNFQPERQ